MLKGILVGVFLCSIMALARCNKMPSEKDLERFEKAKGRPMTDEDIKEEQARLKKSGTVGVIACPIFFVLLIALQIYVGA